MVAIAGFVSLLGLSACGRGAGAPAGRDVADESPVDAVEGADVDAAGVPDAPGGEDADGGGEPAARDGGARDGGARDGGRDGERFDTEDGAAAPDATADADGPPDPGVPFAVREHPGRMADTPWRAPRVEQLRTTDVLPELDLRHVAVTERAIWAASGTGLYVRGDGEPVFRAVPLPPLDGPIAKLAAEPGDRVALAGGTVVTWVSLDEGVAFTAEAPGVVRDTFACPGMFGVVADGAISWFLWDDAPRVWRDGGPHDDVLAVACDGSRWLALRPDGLWQDEAGWERVWAAPEGEPPVALALGAGRVVVATGRRVAVLAGPDGEEVFEAAQDALPMADVRAVAVAPEGHGWAVAHAVGVSLRTPAGPRAFAHRRSRRWLPDDDVRGLAWAPDGSLWVATGGGLAHLTWEETTLAARAERLFEGLDSHDRLGFVSPSARYADPWDHAVAPRLWDDDNDGQWSEEALAALCFAWAATGDARYRDRARRVFEAMRLLFEVPAVSFAAVGRERGFPARSVVRDDEGAVFEDKVPQPNWHRVTWGGHEWYWKDDTSSDETTGHWFGLPLYHDLCARDAAERAEVADLLAALMDTVMAHGFRLVDLDGERTGHGYWDPETLTIALDGVAACLQAHPVEACADAWGGGAFLNALEILGALLATWHVTGDPRYLAAYETLVVEHRYGELATFSEHIVTWTSRPIANVVDHELAALAFLTLIRYEPDPERRAAWLASQLAAWPWEAGERSPLKALALAAATDEDGAWLADGVRTLREYPEDRRDWYVDNGDRTDFRRDVPDRFGEPQFTAVPPYDEVRTMRWDGNPFRVADGGDGHSVVAPTFWLLPYWGLRYHGAIGAPEAAR